MNTSSYGIGQAWVNLAIGLLLLVFFPRLPQFLFTPKSFTWKFTDRGGAPLAYVDSAFFLLDVGVLMLAVALLMVGALHFVRHPGGRIAGVVIGAVTAVSNAAVALATQAEFGLQLLPVIGVVAGVYLVIVDANLLRIAQRTDEHSSAPT